jgi:phosphatidylserine decarboxylase
MFSFVRQTIKQFQTTGAVWPSSPRLARELCAPLLEAIKADSPPLTILEAGPGTGPITAEILRHLRPQDRLVLAEVNPEFIQVLRNRFTKDSRWAAKANQVRIIQGPVQDLDRDGHTQPGEFDIVICGLPFTNFPAGLVSEIFEAFRRQSKVGAPLTWFEYIAVRRIRMSIGGKMDRARIRDLSATMEQCRRMSRCGGSTRSVLTNVLPAWVHRVRLDPPESKVN